MFHTLIIKFNKNMTEKNVKLCSNLVTHVQKYQNGELKRIYSAISIFQLKGTENEVKTITLQQNPQFKFSDRNEIQIWLEDLDCEQSSMIEYLEITALISYCKS